MRMRGKTSILVGKSMKYNLVSNLFSSSFLLNQRTMSNVEINVKQ